MRTYEEIQSSLDKAWRLFEPNRIRFLSEILTWLNHPEKSFKIIQIAGTNGKGFTGAMLREIILAYGFSVGHFSSSAVQRANLD